MILADAPVLEVRPLLREERTDLLTLLRSFTEPQWTASTAVPRWRVKDIALHVLDDDLGWLSRGRDADLSGLLDSTGDYRSFVAALGAKNQRWIDGASGMSGRVLCDLLEWAGAEVDAHYGGLDLAGRADVIWASTTGAPVWLDLARDFTERWVHQQQIREAVDAPGAHARFLGTVLRAFVWAFPHQLAVPADTGDQLELDLAEGGRWVLTRRIAGWELDEGEGDRSSVLATISMSGDTAWRVLTGATYDRAAITATGVADVVDAALHVRGIIV